MTEYKWNDEDDDRQPDERNQTSINKNLHIHQVADTLVMENQNPL